MLTVGPFEPFLPPPFHYFFAFQTKDFFESLLSHSSNSSTVTALDFYASHGIAVEFLCLGVNQASESCQKARELTNSVSSTTMVRNAGESYFYEEDFLILEAHRQGLFWNTTLHLNNRHKLTKALHQQLSDWNTTIQELPAKVCPNKAQAKWLWQRTLENNALAAPFPAVGSHLRTDFDEFLESGKLCSVDAATILSDENWKVFFESACIFQKSMDGINCTRDFVLDAETHSPVATAR